MTFAEVVTADLCRELTWHDYAVTYKRCYCKLAKGRIQTTRQEPAREVTNWLVFLPSPHGCVNVQNIDAARELASQYGCEICL